MSWTDDPLASGVVGGIIAGGIILLGTYLINITVVKRARKNIFRNDLSTYVRDIAEAQDDYESWIGEIRHYIHDKNGLTNFEFRNYLNSQLNIIEQSLERGQLPITEIESTVEDIKKSKF